MNEQAPRINPGIEEQPNSGAEPEKLEITETPEMPADFVEPEGKSGKWGEVVENKELGVRYREKVIELPKHRQEETGVKRIRRRELLPPFPEGLFTSTDQSDRTAQLINEDGLSVQQKIAYYSTDDKFDQVYQFLTDGGYPSDYAWVHSIEIGLSTERAERRDTAVRVDKFKKEGIYFQEIKRDVFCETRNFFSWSAHFSTPIFVFNNKNAGIVKYIFPLPRGLPRGPCEGRSGNHWFPV